MSDRSCVQRDAASRKQLAERSHKLRESMAHNKADLRQQRSLARRQRTMLEAAWHRHADTAAAAAFDCSQLEAEVTALRNAKVTALVSSNALPPNTYCFQTLDSALEGLRSLVE
jgi:hypothetical protein